MRLSVAELRARLAAGQSYRAISGDIGTDPNTLSRFAKLHGLASAYQSKGRPLKFPYNAARLSAMLTSGHSLHGIARIAGCDYKTVWKWAKAFGLSSQYSRGWQAPAKPLTTGDNPGNVNPPCAGGAWTDDHYPAHNTQEPNQ